MDPRHPRRERLTSRTAVAPARDPHRREFKCASGAVATAGVLLLCLAAGCDKLARYDYRGELRRPDGVTPVRGAKVHVGSADLRPSEADAEVLRNVERTAKTTDERGRFRGRFNCCEKYSGLDLNPPPAPELKEPIGLWVRRGAGWDSVTIPPGDLVQPDAYPGGRRVRLPPAIVPEDPAHPMYVGGHERP